MGRDGEKPQNTTAKRIIGIAASQYTTRNFISLIMISVSFFFLDIQKAQPEINAKTQTQSFVGEFKTENISYLLR